MIAWTKARKFPGVRWCTSRTMAALQLYFIAIPRRRSLAAAIARKVKLESRKRERGLYTRSEQLQAREILRVHYTYRDFVVINHDEIVDAVGLEQFENFDREYVFVHGH